MKERIGYYDIARGLGIIFVVIGHIGTFYGPFRSFIITFHMALFFMISGMLIFETKEEERSLTEIIKKKFFRIMIPYILFSVLSIIIEFVRLSLQDIYFWPHFRALFVTAGSFYGNSVMWFLPALFISEIIFLIIRRIKKDIMTVLSVLVLAALTIWANTLPTVGNQFLQSFTAAMIRGVYCTIFICIGYYVRKYIMTLKIQNFVYGCWAILLMRLSFALNQFNPKVDLRAMYWGERGIATTSKTVLVSYQASLYLIGAVSGALGIIFLCKCLESFSNCGIFKVLIFFGGNSLIIMATHLDWHVLHYGIDLAAILNEIYPSSMLYHMYVLVFVFAVEAMLILLINKYLPILSGKLKK